jgi:hypothetical protein
MGVSAKEPDAEATIIAADLQIFADLIARLLAEGDPVDQQRRLAEFKGHPRERVGRTVAS